MAATAEGVRPEDRAWGIIRASCENGAYGHVAPMVLVRLETFTDISPFIIAQ